MDCRVSLRSPWPQTPEFSPSDGAGVCSTLALGHNPAFLPVELSKSRTPGLHTSYPHQGLVTGGAAQARAQKAPSQMESAFPHASLQPPVLKD